MLITVGIRLAHPREFGLMYKIGREQLAIFVVTIFFTLFEDLLVGIAAGIALKMIINVVNGAPLSAMFKAPVVVTNEGENYKVEVQSAAVFSNYLSIKSKLDSLPQGADVTIDLKKTKLVDHSVMESLHHFQHDYEAQGGHVRVIGLEQHQPVSTHELAARKKANVKA
jgi:MFS superfamily sulfate permease-like transporter